MNVILIGFMCAGKTHVGRRLAAHLGWTHVDTDDVVVRAEKKTVADIIRERGEPAFRAAEAVAVTSIVQKDRQVISTGGGVATNPENVAALRRNGKIVWLDVSAETVLKRAGAIASRPLIDPADPLGSIQRRMAERHPIYEAAADLRISTDTATLDAITAEILKGLPEVAS